MNIIHLMGLPMGKNNETNNQIISKRTSSAGTHSNSTKPEFVVFEHFKLFSLVLFLLKVPFKDLLLKERYFEILKTQPLKAGSELIKY